MLHVDDRRLQNMCYCLNERVILPQNIQPYVFTNLSWDNIDRLEATVTGAGTSHRVNGIAVQPKVFGPHLPIEALPAIAKRKKRTIPVETQELPLYVSGEKKGPHPLQVSSDDLPQHEMKATAARRKDLLWMLSRIVDTERQVIPSWTGFNIQTRDSVNSARNPCQIRRYQGLP